MLDKNGHAADDIIREINEILPPSFRVLSVRRVAYISISRPRGISSARGRRNCRCCRIVSRSVARRRERKKTDASRSCANDRDILERGIERRASLACGKLPRVSATCREVADAFIWLLVPTVQDQINVTRELLCGSDVCQ